MPQGPILVQTVAPSFTALDVTTAQVLKATPGVIATIVIVAAGTAGNLTINNCITTGAATAANTVFKAAFGSLSVGQVITLNAKCNVGITLSTITTGCQYTITYS